MPGVSTSFVSEMVVCARRRERDLESATLTVPIRRLSLNPSQIHSQTWNSSTYVYVYRSRTAVDRDATYLLNVHVTHTQISADSKKTVAGVVTYRVLQLTDERVLVLCVARVFQFHYYIHCEQYEHLPHNCRAFHPP